MVLYQIKLLPAISASHIGASLNHHCSTYEPVPFYVSEKAPVDGLSSCAPAAHVGDLDEASGSCLGLAHPVHFNHLGRKPVDRSFRSVSLSQSSCLILTLHFKQIFFFISNCFQKSFQTVVVSPLNYL